MIKRKFTVTQDDIDEADLYVGSPTKWDRALYCPVAQCLKRDGQPIAAVLPSHVNWTGQPRDRGFSMLSKSVRRAIAKYDRVGEMKPFSFILEVPG